MSQYYITYNPPLPFKEQIANWIKEFDEGMKQNNGYICEADCTSPRCPANKPKPMQTKYIPEEIINECAYEAYRATYNHYERTTRPDISVWDTDPRLQKRVIKDVKAVLYGNRTPADLHEAWAHRKMVARGYDMLALRNIAPTAETPFEYLSKDDQRGYEVFVETVKATYQKLQKKTGRPSGVRLFEYSASNEVAGFGRTSGKERSLVEVYFDTFQEAQAFYNQLETNSK